MLRLSHILTTTALLAVCAAPASAITYEDMRSSYQPAVKGQDLRSPDARDAAEHRGIYAAKPDTGPYVLNRDYGSPDAADAARDLPPVQIPAPVVTVDNPSTGFEWGDAGIGAAGMLALLCISLGLTMGAVQSRRRRGQSGLAH
jgi:hypothetical protein